MFKDKIDEAEKEYGGGNRERYKFKKGSNRVRLLAGIESIATHWIGQKGFTCFGKENGCQYHGDKAPQRDGVEIKPQVKFAVYLLDKSEENSDIHLVFLPWSVVKALDDYASDPDYKFDSLPMPYDITVKYDPDASPMEMYKVLASPNRNEVDTDILEALAKKKSLKSIVDKIKTKAKEESGDGDNDESEIPSL